MNPWPTSGPMMSSNNQYARDENNSARSLFSSAGSLREGKKDLLETTGFDARPRAQLDKRALAHHASMAQQYEPVTHASRVVQLVNGQKESASRRRNFPKQIHCPMRLPQ